MVRSSAARSAVLLLALAAAAEPLQPILTYIRTTWGVLTRSNRTLAESAADPKFRPGADGRWPVYISRQEDLSRIGQQLRTQMDVTAFEKTAVRRLPEAPNTITEQGLLYLPLPYVVPGGRFNEMYGWGSYFIQLGLLRDDMTDLARNMADNFLYEIKNYGWILNANRTYYLTRSQPPFLTEMLLNVYRQTHDLQWLEHALTEVETYYQYWTREPHLTPQTGLSRYFNLGEGPAPEVMASERDSQGRTHYGRARQYFRTHKVSDYDASQYYDRWNDRLTPAFYKGDRSMRESGFDPSERFGALNVDITHYNPVCLNSLLYVQEIETAEMLRDIGRDAGAALWQSRADTRAERINRLMWDAGGGLYYDYDFSRKRVRHYPFLTTFYPLWAGIASPAQAARVVGNLKLFERPGGLMTSTKVTGDQWDAPFGWSPLELIAVEGLRRYGFKLEADRVAEEFLLMVIQQYRSSGTIVEKYDVLPLSTDLHGQIRFGYAANQVGFGWTNAVFTTLLDGLDSTARNRLLESGVAR